MPKYEFTGETKRTIVYGRKATLHRIRAVRDFGSVMAGELGGWIEKEENLSHAGEAWVSGNAEVFGNAEIFDHAEVCDHAIVFDAARVYGDARIHGNAYVYGCACVYGNADVGEKR